MRLASLSFLAPLGLLVCLSMLVPLGVAVHVSRTQRRAARAVGLHAVAAAPFVTAALMAVVCVGVGIAAAQPVVTSNAVVHERTSSEIVFVVDVSRSMLAASGPGQPARLERARSVVARLRSAVPDVPAGISGLTDRVLPYLFPTRDRDVFSKVLAQSVRIDAPPPQEVAPVVTSFKPLASLVRYGFFAPGTEHRTCVLVTDGETRTQAELAGLAGRRGCRLVVVRVGSVSDRIFSGDRTVDPAYRPEASAAATVETLVRSAGGSSFTENQVPGAARAVANAAEQGPERQVRMTTGQRSLAPYAAVAALACAVLCVLRALLPGRRWAWPGSEPSLPLGEGKTHAV